MCAYTRVWNAWALFCLSMQFFAILWSLLAFARCLTFIRSPNLFLNSWPRDLCVGLIKYLSRPIPFPVLSLFGKYIDVFGVQEPEKEILGQSSDRKLGYRINFLTLGFWKYLSVLGNLFLKASLLVKFLHRAKVHFHLKHGLAWFFHNHWLNTQR